MPMRPPRPCTTPGCTALVTNGSRCEVHRPKRWGGRAPASARGYGAAWQRLRAEVLKRDGGLCQPCRRAGRVTQAFAVDHIRPKSEGGQDTAANTEAICRTCHAQKSSAEGHRRREALEARERARRDARPQGG